SYSRGLLTRIPTGDKTQREPGAFLGLVREEEALRIYKAIVTWCVLPILLWLCVSGCSASAAETWGLLIGVSKYQNPQITSLKYPAEDAASIRDALVDPQLGQVPADHVRLITDEQATRGNIFDGVRSFLAKGVKPGDQVIVFMAGHGVTKGV